MTAYLCQDHKKAEGVVEGRQAKEDPLGSYSPLIILSVLTYLTIV